MDCYKINIIDSCNYNNHFYIFIYNYIIWYIHSALIQFILFVFLEQFKKI